MSSCTCCSRMAIGFLYRGNTYCSLHCMNTGPVTKPPYEATEAQVGPCNATTKQEAMDYVKAVLHAYQTICRQGREPHALIHHEHTYIPEVVRRADPSRLVPSIIEAFKREADMEIPF